MEQINTIDKISAVYRNTAEEARQELNKVQQKILPHRQPAPAAICGRSSRNLSISGARAGVYWPALPSSPYCRSYF